MSGPILITGATGLLGRAVVGRFSALADRPPVYALVRDPRAAALPPGVQAIAHDLGDRADPPVGEAPETIIHQAQSRCFRDFPNGALDVFEVNVGATQRLLDWGLRNGVRRFVYLSTGGVYGHGADPFRECDRLPLLPAASHYIASKRGGEALAAAYCGRMIVVILRPFFVYGRGQHPEMLIPRLIQRVSTGLPLFLQQRDGLRLNPVHVDDAAGAVLAAAGLDGDATINVAGPEVLSLREIGGLIGAAVGRAPRFEVDEAAEPRHLVGDTAAMSRLLLPPRVTLARGLAEMAAAPAGTGLSHVV